jgi:uncharacterized RDD family membrane protein YckC
MAGWPQPQMAGVPAVQLPPGLQVAGMWRRFFAYILDNIFVALIGLIPIVWAIAARAVAFNQEALDRADKNAAEPFAHVSVPLLTVDTNLLIAAAVLFIALELLYFVACWSLWRGGLGQRILSLQVADARTGNNLTLSQSILRWAALYGLSALSALGVVVALEVMATVPASASMGGSSTDALEPGSSLATWSAIANAVSWLGMLWAIVLLISAATNPARRGLHDRLGGSLVVGRARVAWPGYAYPPQAAYPAPPQAAYPAPPQAAYPAPPQAAYPPQAGFPQGGAGYPGPGIIPPAVPPAAPPTTPPAAPPGTPGGQTRDEPKDQGPSS